jgi:hypothetical protein
MSNAYAYLPNEFKDKRPRNRLNQRRWRGHRAPFCDSWSFRCARARSPCPEGQKPALFVQTDLSSVESIAQLAERIMSE